MYTHGNTVVRTLQLWQPEVMYNMIQFAKTTCDGSETRGEPAAAAERGRAASRTHHLGRAATPRHAAPHHAAPRSSAAQGHHGRAASSREEAGGSSQEGPACRRKVW